MKVLIAFAQEDDYETTPFILRVFQSLDENAAKKYIVDRVAEIVKDPFVNRPKDDICSIIPHDHYYVEGCSWRGYIWNKDLTKIGTPHQVASFKDGGYCIWFEEHEIVYEDHNDTRFGDY